MNPQNMRLLVLAAVGFVVLLVLMDGLYVVNETQQVVITQFGEPREPAVTDPGVHFKIPFIQKANYFEKRFLEWDGDPNQVPTRDKRFLWVNTYARWRISDPLRFFQRLRDERGAQSRLDDILDGETRSAVARQELVEVVRTSNREPEELLLDSDEETAILEVIEMGREAITRQILANAQKRAADLGIELLDVRFKRINYVEEVQRDVFERMIAERQRIAQRYRSEGQGEAARIRGEKERDLAQIQSEAYRKAEEIRGTADGTATDVYAEAYSRDVTFYTFMKSLETYENTADGSSTLILTTDSDLLRFLKRTP
jgi:modulator of FtsH protease HflC